MRSSTLDKRAGHRLVQENLDAGPEDDVDVEGILRVSRWPSTITLAFLCTGLSIGFVVGSFAPSPGLYWTIVAVGNLINLGVALAVVQFVIRPQLLVSAHNKTLVLQADPVTGSRPIRLVRTSSQRVSVEPTRFGARATLEGERLFVNWTDARGLG